MHRAQHASATTPAHKAIRPRKLCRARCCCCHGGRWHWQLRRLAATLHLLYLSSSNSAVSELGSRSCADTSGGAPAATATQLQSGAWSASATRAVHAVLGAQHRLPAQPSTTQQQLTTPSTPSEPVQQLTLRRQHLRMLTLLYSSRFCVQHSRVRAAKATKLLSSDAAVAGSTRNLQWSQGWQARNISRQH